MSKEKTKVTGYLPDERPSVGKMLLFAFQQILVMFPATVTVAILTGFHISTTIFASGLATICFLLITKGTIPLYYGSSFSYIAAICGITSSTMVNGIASDAAISQAQFGIIMSGLVSIAAGLIINKSGQDKIEKILPPTITGSIAIIIGLSLAGTAMTSSAGYVAETGSVNPKFWFVAIITLLATIIFSVYLQKGVMGQLPILLGMIVGYVVSIPLGLVNFGAILSDGIFTTPHFTLPTPNWQSVLAIMPIAIATIPESTAHLYQLDLYVNDLAEKKGSKKKYNIGDKLGLNLIGDGIGDIVSAMFGGPAGTNYGENISTMAITRNFSVWVLRTAALLTIVISFFAPLTNIVSSIPAPVINGACIYLFGVIGVQGVAIMISKKVDLFDARNLAVIAIILIIGIGGSFGFPDGNIIITEDFSAPAIATASIVGILLNLVLNIGKKQK